MSHTHTHTHKIYINEKAQVHLSPQSQTFAVILLHLVKVRSGLLMYRVTYSIHPPPLKLGQGY